MRDLIGPSGARSFASGDRVRAGLRFAATALMASALIACTPSHVDVRQSPESAIDAVAARMTARGIALDASGRRPDRVRTAWFCYRAPDQTGQHWDRTFARPGPSPIAQTHRGTFDAQSKFEAKCPHLFRAEITAAAGHEGTTARVQVATSWWQLEMGRCAPVGDPMLAELDCAFRYAGARPVDDPARFFYGLLAGL